MKYHLAKRTSNGKCTTDACECNTQNNQIVNAHKPARVFRELYKKYGSAYCCEKCISIGIRQGRIYE